MTKGWTHQRSLRSTTDRGGPPRGAPIRTGIAGGGAEMSVNEQSSVRELVCDRSLPHSVVSPNGGKLANHFTSRRGATGPTRA